MLTDGTYTYQYDNEGNRTARFVDNDSSGTLNSGDTSITEYEWDHRNRLTKVTERSTYGGGAATKIVEYAYDYGQRWVRKTLDTDADGTIEESQVFVHDSGQIVLDFQKTGTADASNSDLAHRYLWGGSVDELLADETVDDATEDDVAWALTDHLGSVRDLVVYDPTTETVSVVKHVVYDAFGNVTSDTATSVESLFLYTARPFEPDTELQNNLNRWYDATTGRWLSTDPIGFEAGDVNLYRYVRGNPSTKVDPTGLSPVFDAIKKAGVIPCGSLSIHPGRHKIEDLQMKGACPTSSSPIAMVGIRSVIERGIRASVNRKLGLPFDASTPCPNGCKCKALLPYKGHLTLPAFPVDTVLYFGGKNNLKLWKPEDHNGVVVPPSGSGYNKCSLSFRLSLDVEITRTLGACACES